MQCKMNGVCFQQIRGLLKCFQHANVIKQENIITSLELSLTGKTGQYSASFKNLSALLIRWHCTFFHQKSLLTQTPVHYVDRAQLFDKLKLKTDKASGGGIFILHRRLDIFFYSDNGLQRLLGPLYGCFN